MKLSPFADAIDTDHTRKRSILAAACAVGVVGTFGTPIGGVLFSVEVPPLAPPARSPRVLPGLAAAAAPPMPMPAARVPAARPRR